MKSSDDELRVHADELTERGDLRGELILASLAGETALAERLQKEISARWLAPRDGVTIAMTWTHGYWDALWFRAAPDVRGALELFRELTSDPSASRVVGLAVIELGPRGGSLDGLADKLPPSVRSLTVGIEASGQTLSDLAVFAGLPLEKLNIGARLLAATRLPSTLRALTLRGYPTAPAMLAALDLSRLEELSFICADADWDGATLDADRLPTLRRLTVEGAGRVFLGGLVGGRLLARLDELELAGERPDAELYEILRSSREYERLALGRYDPAGE
jgi:hypothetical protein